MAVDWQVYYRVNDDNSGPELLLEVFRERGWLPWEESQPNNNEEAINNNSTKFTSSNTNSNNRYDDKNGIRSRKNANGINKNFSQINKRERNLKTNSEYAASSRGRANGSTERKDGILSESCEWHLWWRHGFPLGLYTRLRPNQILSHIPKGQGLCRKDSLARALQSMRKAFGTVYDFYPTTFLLPCEYTKLVAEYTKLLHHNTPSTCCTSSKSTTPSTTPPSSRRRSSNSKEPRVSSLHTRNSTGQISNTRRKSFTQQKSQSDQNTEEFSVSTADSGYGSTEFNGYQNYVSACSSSQDCKISSWNRKTKENQCRPTVGQHFKGDLSSRYVSDDEKEANVWICKPTTSSQGRGITIFEDVHELKYGDSAVAQRYIERPLLVGGYKCDLRLYVLVTSLSPLTVYLYREGIVRFSTEKYSMAALDRPYSHLTNTSLNKSAPGYSVEKDRVGAGCKWSLRQLRHHLRTSGTSDWLLWQRISCVVSLTLLAHVTKLRTEATLPHGMTNCFELYGFDILVDEKLNPWLLEVNRCPSLSYDCDVDRYVKKPMLHHLFDLLGPPRVAQPIEKLLNPPPKLPDAAKTWDSSVSGSSGEDGECSSFNEESEEEFFKENDACSSNSSDQCEHQTRVSSDERKLVQVSGEPKENNDATYETFKDRKPNDALIGMYDGKFISVANTKQSKFKIRKVSSKSSRSNSVCSNISRYSYSIRSDDNQNESKKSWETVGNGDGTEKFISGNKPIEQHSNRHISRKSEQPDKNVEYESACPQLKPICTNEDVDFQLASDVDGVVGENLENNSKNTSSEKYHQPSKGRKRSDLVVLLEGSNDNSTSPVSSGRVSRIREVRFSRKSVRKSSVKRKRTSTQAKCMSITNRLYYNRFSDEYLRKIVGNSTDRTLIGENKSVPLRLNLSKIGMLQTNHQRSRKDGLVIENDTRNPPLEITRVSLSPPLRPTSSPASKASSSHLNRSNLEHDASSRKVPRKSCGSEATGGRVSSAGQVAEELSSDTYVPVAFNSSFQRLRRQLLGVAIDSGRSRSHSSPSGGHSRRRKDDWSVSSGEGGWVRTFPFNTATAHATKHPLQVRVAVLEVHKYRKLCEKIFNSSQDADKSGDHKKKTESDQNSKSRYQRKEEKYSDSDNSYSQDQANAPFCNSKFYYYRVNTSTQSRKEVYSETPSPVADASRKEGCLRVETSFAANEDAGFSAQTAPLLWKDQVVWTPGF